MANVTITSTANILKVDMGDYASEAGVKKENWHKSSIHFKLVAGETFVKVGEDNGTDFAICFEETCNAYIVDSVDGVAPTSNEHLYNLLVALL